jgi:hypothetical protein
MGESLEDEGISEVELEEGTVSEVEVALLVSVVVAVSWSVIRSDSELGTTAGFAVGAVL